MFRNPSVKWIEINMDTISSHENLLQNDLYMKLFSLKVEEWDNLISSKEIDLKDLLIVRYDLSPLKETKGGVDNFSASNTMNTRRKSNFVGSEYG
jgi:hypothetical protein